MEYQKAGSNFFNELYGMLTAFEGPHRRPKDVGDGVITIGVGYNLTTGEDSVRRLTLQQLGLKLEANTAAQVTPAILLERVYLKRLIDALKAGPSQIDTLHQIMADRASKAASDPSFAAYIGSASPRSSFEFSSGVLGDIEMKAVMQEGIKPFASKVDSKLGYSTGNAPDQYQTSWERVVLISLAFNGFGAWPSGLTKAIQSGDRAEAWFQIRYLSNYIGSKFSQGTALSVKEQIYFEKNIDKGWAKRRYAEAEIFGLYDKPSAVTEAEAKQIYKMLETHRAEIFAYEKYYGLTPDGSVGLRGNQVAVAASEYQYLVGTKTLVQSLEPARKAFIEWLNTTLPADKQFTASAIDAINPAAIYYGGDNVPVQVLDARADDARSGNDLNKNILVGGSGSDILIGGKNDDVLVGRAGLDTYIQITGDGNDTLIDSDRKGRIILNSAANENANQAASLFIGVPGQANTWKSLDGALTLTRDGPGGNWLLSFEGGSIDLGGSLDQGQLGMRWIDAPVEPQINGSTLLGDRKPLTAEELAGQSPTDVLGNVRTGDTPENNRADTLSGSANNDHIQSLGGNDIIDGKDGDDYIEAGGGQNLLMGAEGDDSYIVRSADVTLAPVPEGQPQMLTTTIDDALGSNRIRLDVAEQPLSVVKVNEGYGLLWAANGGQAGVHLQNMGTAGHASVEFSDGRTVTVRQIVGEGLAQEQYVYSNTTGEVLIGGALNDELVGNGQGRSAARACRSVVMKNITNHWRPITGKRQLIGSTAADKRPMAWLRSSTAHGDAHHGRFKQGGGA